MQETRESLLPGTTVDCYSIIKRVGSGGFSLIYLAEDEDSQERVILKEYLPRKLAQRLGSTRVEIAPTASPDQFERGRKLFFQEAKALSQLSHPNIVNVRTFFLANNTAYLVMDYEQGRNLATYIKRHNGKLSTALLLTVFPAILDALSLVHSANQIHLDIKPSNIHLRSGGRPLLLDFGAIHQLATTRSGMASQVITPGFSPVEQYYSSGYVGPWSDIYAIGATMRACIEGKAPPSAIERHAKDRMQPAVKLFKRHYPKYLLEIIDWAMEVDPLLRPQGAEELSRALLLEEGRPEVSGVAPDFLQR
ncbi:MAG: serine/threonine protein kinase [Gammaproteobacteria bacterium]|nr:serine/threonine protein kinase [Gammaproteobacteria bacterium]MCP5406362.1 serine/threonine protein kinase [Chromatiaceae bacterium]MCP5408030.1 serine/threonine protein kinase [Chromatiaceae bacterium]MCP5442929.1 serine/threonine protein kinase [Chromatiaceae bacterium]